jgi:hypothetical protein
MNLQFSPLKVIKRESGIEWGGQVYAHSKKSEAMTDFIFVSLLI